MQEALAQRCMLRNQHGKVYIALHHLLGDQQDLGHWQAAANSQHNTDACVKVIDDVEIALWVPRSRAVICKLSPKKCKRSEVSDSNLGCMHCQCHHVQRRLLFFDASPLVVREGTPVKLMQSCVSEVLARSRRCFFCNVESVKHGKGRPCVCVCVSMVLVEDRSTR
eukprot:4926548-Amphidinium_carterae.2